MQMSIFLTLLLAQGSRQLKFLLSTPHNLLSIMVVRHHMHKFEDLTGLRLTIKKLKIDIMHSSWSTL